MDDGGAGQRPARAKRHGKEGSGTAGDPVRERQTSTARDHPPEADEPELMEEVLHRQNMWAAYKRVVRNRGAAGVDGMTVEQLLKHCEEHWPKIKKELLQGTYNPAPVRRVEIPKPGGGTRTLGIPTVMDRMIQQALVQALTPQIDPAFSDDSYGYRPGRSVQDAVKRARDHVVAGHDWVVDLDLENFFDGVNHDVLMARLAHRIEDKRVLRLIRRFLQAGVMEGGATSPRTEGTPQGGPLSPLLSNVLLDDLDKELEARGHHFVRYADDVQVYVKSEAAGTRVMQSLERFLRKRLRLTVNRRKSAVSKHGDRPLLGHLIIRHRGKVKVKVAPKASKKLKAKLKTIFRRGRGRTLRETTTELAPITRGWVSFYRYTQTEDPFRRLDQWLRRHMRVIVWRQWKTLPTAFYRLLELGVPRDHASKMWRCHRGPWAHAGAPYSNQGLTIRYFEQHGLLSFLDEFRRVERPA